MRKQTPLTAKPQRLCIREGVLPSPTPRTQFPELIRMQNQMMAAAQLMFQATICLTAILPSASLAVQWQRRGSPEMTACRTMFGARVGIPNCLYRRNFRSRGCS